MHRNNSNASHVLRRFIQQAESYNRCIFANNSATLTKKNLTYTKDHVIDAHLYCQGTANTLNVSTKSKTTEYKATLNYEINLLTAETLLVDIVSNGYKYETSSFKMNVVQQCCIISIISPYAFTIQLTKDLLDCDTFFKHMNDYYNSVDNLHIPNDYLRRNLLCVTWDVSTSTWNRSQIMEFDLSDNTVNVFYVDLNSWEEHVRCSRIRFILTKYSSRPVYILTCRLASIMPFREGNESYDVISKTFQNVVQNCACDVELLHKGRDNTFYVNLFASHDEAYVCMNDFLIHCKMAKPMDDILHERNTLHMLNDNGQPMCLMMTLYWKAGEAMHKKEALTYSTDDSDRMLLSTDEFQSKCTLKTKLLIRVVTINEQRKLIFAKYNSYVMLPWFTISNILQGLNEETMKIWASKYGLKPIVIDPLSHPLLCSQLRKLEPSMVMSSQIGLYSIDCARKIFQAFNCTEMNIYNLLDCARFAESNGDITLWDEPSEVELENFLRAYPSITNDTLQFTRHSDKRFERIQ